MYSFLRNNNNNKRNNNNDTQPQEGAPFGVLQIAGIEKPDRYIDKFTDQTCNDNEGLNPQVHAELPSFVLRREGRGGGLSKPFI